MKNNEQKVFGIVIRIAIVTLIGVAISLTHRKQGNS